MVKNDVCSRKVFPPLNKGGEGGFLRRLAPKIKSPSIPLFQRGRSKITGADRSNSIFFARSPFFKGGGQDALLYLIFWVTP
jgi:hypothetical protein